MEGNLSRSWINSEKSTEKNDSAVFEEQELSASTAGVNNASKDVIV